MLFLSVQAVDVKLAGKTRNIDPMWKVQRKKSIWTSQRHSWTTYMGCTQRECDTSKDIEDNYRNMFASMTCAGAKGKLFCSGRLGADIFSWFFDMEGNAKKCVERCCELVNKKPQ